MRFNIKNVFAIGALLITAWASLATSSSGSNSIDSADLYVISDCVNPVMERQVRTTNGVITAGGVDFTNFGFPQSTVKLDQDNNGIVNNGVTNVSRSCIHSYGDMSNNANSKYVFSCLDNGNYSCSILIMKL